MSEGYELKEGVIIINRELSSLDIFVKDFLNILEKYSDYLVVSGFVSISSGRTRGTEDVDILFTIMGEREFSLFFEELKENGFWCYQSNDWKEAHDYIKEMQSIRFAKADELFPNIEFIPINEKRKAKFFEFTHPQKIKIRDFEFKIPPLEFEILYKELVLCGEKDLDDAAHLRTFFSKILNKDKFKDYEPIIREELK